MENGGFDKNVKAGKSGGAESFHGGAKVFGLLGARIVGVFQAIERQNHEEARDGAEFVDTPSQERTIHFVEYGSAAIDDLAGQVADARVLQGRIATDPHYRRGTCTNAGQSLLIS